MSAYPPEECCAHPADHHGPEAGGCIDCRCTACPKVTPDAVTAATPTLRHHDDGRLSLEWADEPKPGDVVLIKADVLRRLVDRTNYLRGTLNVFREELLAESEKNAQRPPVAPSGASEGGAGVPGPPETDASVNAPVGPFFCQDCGKRITQAGDSWIWTPARGVAARVCKACWHTREEAAK